MIFRGLLGKVVMGASFLEAALNIVPRIGLCFYVYMWGRLLPELVGRFCQNSDKLQHPPLTGGPLRPKPCASVLFASRAFSSCISADMNIHTVGV